MSNGFDGSMPEHYARLLEPILFNGFAEDASQRLRLSSGGTVLDIACGTGVVARKIQAQYPTATVISTDYSLAMVKQARQNPMDHVVTANGIHLPFRDYQFDAATCQFGLMFMPDPGAALREARRVLAPRGQLLFSVWESPESNPVW
ncbi:MAG: class I SAM-dependent methyltransferase, partial [Fimbriimonas sp.]